MPKYRGRHIVSLYCHGLTSHDGVTNLGSVREEGGLLVVQGYGLGVQIDGSRVVARGERLVPLVLEVDSRLGHGDAANR